MEVVDSSDGFCFWLDQENKKQCQFHLLHFQLVKP